MEEAVAHIVRVDPAFIVDPEAGGPAAVHEVAQLDREELRIGPLGLHLAEAKAVLQRVQGLCVVEDPPEGFATGPGCAPGSPDYEKLRATYLGFWQQLRQTADADQDGKVTRDRSWRRTRHCWRCGRRSLVSPKRSYS